MGGSKKDGTYLVVEFLLEGGSEISGHLSNGIAGRVADPGVLKCRWGGDETETSVS